MSNFTNQPDLRPAVRLANVRAYDPPARRWTTDLRLDANEGAPPGGPVFTALRACDSESLRRYPDTGSLEASIAGRWGIDPHRVVVTNGGDDAIDRVCRAMLEPGRCLLTHTPTFEMIPRGARLADAEVTTVAWCGGAFPEAAFLNAITPGTGLVALVTPNNPTGGVIPKAAIASIAQRARSVGAAVLLDLAYIDFADDDPTPGVLDLDNVVVMRTFSKAYGLAGLRVGYAISPQMIAGWLRAAGGPYPVPGVSIAGASAAWETGADAYVRAVRSERSGLVELCAEHGLPTLPTQANFVTVCSERAGWVRDALGSLGIAVRLLDSAASPGLCRITLPGDAGAYARLSEAIAVAASPQALLLDLDGVLADVSSSYRRAIIETAASFGVTLTPGDIAAAKAAGNANNDWELTRRLLANRGVDAALTQVVDAFQSVYLGGRACPGLRESERLIPDAALLRTLRGRLPLAIVTGRPRDEAEWFLQRSGVRACFDTVVAMEDAPAKPAADGVRLAMSTLGVDRAWMIGDTPDDAAAARAAGVVPIGVCAPAEPDTASTLERAGVARVLRDLSELQEVLP